MDNNTINKTQRVRGSARIQPDGTFDFKPDGQGVKKIEEVRQARKSRCYRTAGEKQQTLVAHLTVDANAKDPAYEMYKDFREVVKTLPGFEKLPTPQGRVLEKRRTVAAPVIQSGCAEECHAVQNDAVLISIFFENSSLDFQRYGENFVPLYRKKRTINP